MEKLSQTTTTATKESRNNDTETHFQDKELKHKKLFRTMTASKKIYEPCYFSNCGGKDAIPAASKSKKKTEFKIIFSCFGICRKICNT